jgi:hypothetical protein
VKLITELERGIVSETEVARIERDFCQRNFRAAEQKRRVSVIGFLPLALFNGTIGSAPQILDGGSRTQFLPPK